MKKIMPLLLVCVGLLVTSFTVLPTNLNSSSSTTSMDTLKVTWNIGQGGGLEYLIINDDLLLNDVSGKGTLYRAIDFPFSQSTSFKADLGYEPELYSVTYDPSGKVLSATATFIPLL